MKKIVSTFALMIAVTANAQTAPVWIQGTLDCGLWMDGRKSGNASVLEHYVMGTINGMALGRSMEIWNAKGVETTRSQLYYWMDSFCAKNPLKTVVTGLFDFADEKTGGAWSKASNK